MNRLLRVFLILPPLLAQAQNGPESPEDPFRGLWKPVRLIAKDIDVIAALQEISRQAGNPSIQWPRLEPKKIDLQLEQATFWQALDEICRLHGNLRFSSDPDELTAHLDRQAWVEPRAAYAGPFRFYVQQIVRVREIKYPERRDRIEVTIQRRETEEPPRGFDWTGKGRKLELVAVVSDTGRSLLPLVKLVDDPFVHTRPIFNSFGNRMTFLLQPALSNEKSIARLDAVWTQVVLEDPETIRFDPAIPSVGQTRRVGPISVTLSSLKPGERRGQAGYYDVEFLVKLDSAGLSEVERKLFSEIPVEERLLRNGFRATPTPFGAYQLVRGDDPLQVTIKGSLIGSGDPVASIECAVARKARRITVPFTITNIRIPEE